MISYLFILLIIALIFIRKEIGLYVITIFAPAFSSINLPGIGTVYFVLSIVLFLVYYREIYKILKVDFPYKYVIISTAIAWLLSVFVASEKHYYGLFIMLVSYMVTPICCWISFRDKKNIKLFFKIAIILSLIVIIYSLVEVVTKSNPYVNLCLSQNVFAGQLIEDVRFGFKRCQAFFAYHETLGGFASVIGAFFLCLFLFDDLPQKLQIKMLYIAISLFVVGFLTGSRSSILGIVVSLLPFFLKKKKYIYILPLLLLVIACVMPDYFQEILDSFVNTDSVSGSNSDMRKTQLDLSLSYLSKSDNVWFGQGFAFTDNHVIGVETGMAGAESIWFRVIIDQGILGVLCVLYSFLYSIIVCWKINKKFIYFPIAYLIIRTVAVVPAMEMSYIYPYIMLLFVLHKNNKQ